MTLIKILEINLRLCEPGAGKPGSQVTPGVPWPVLIERDEWGRTIPTAAPFAGVRLAGSPDLKVLGTDPATVGPAEAHWPVRLAFHLTI